jgi:hypothetical protein
LRFCPFLPGALTTSSPGSMLARRARRPPRRDGGRDGAAPARCRRRAWRRCDGPGRRGDVLRGRGPPGAPRTVCSPHR